LLRFDRDQVATGDNGPVYASVMSDEEYDPDDHWHDFTTYSSPEMREYYRLCRLYEHRCGISPKDNPYVTSADKHFSSCFLYIDGHFAAFFDDDKYTTKLCIEICPEEYGAGTELIYGIHETLAYYGEHLNELRRELMRGPFVFLPQLPAPKGEENSAQNNI